MDLLLACGWPNWISLLVALGGVAFATVALTWAMLRAPRARTLSWAAVAVALLPVGVGSAGMVMRRSATERLIASGLIPPSEFETFREEGYRYAGGCVTTGVVLAALPSLLAAIALIAAYALRARAAPPVASGARIREP